MTGWSSAAVSRTLMTDEREAQNDVEGCQLIEGMH